MDKQRFAWRSLFEEIGLTIEQGRAFLAEIAKWWQGDEMEITGRMTPTLKYKVTKELDSNEGLLIFNVNSKVIVAYVRYTNQNTFILNAYMVPEKEK